MTTEQATKIIAEDLTHGGAFSAESTALKRSAGCMLTEADYERWIQGGKKEKYMPKAERYDRALRALIPNAREWHWDAVAQCIRTAYVMLGADQPIEPKNSGYAFHCGKHPIQDAMANLETR